MVSFDRLRRIGVIKLAILALAMSISGSASTAIGAESSKEYQVKAAFLFNFIKFVTWPKNALGAKEPFHLCILGPDPFGRILKTIGQRAIKDRPIVIRRFGSSAMVDGCHLLFIGLETEALGENIVANLTRNGLLTVGDSPGLAQRGTAINLVTEGKKVRFEINIGAARRAALQMDAQLLQLGRLVSSGS